MVRYRCLLAALLVFASPAIASAANPLKVPKGAMVTLDKDQDFSDVIIESGGKLKVTGSDARDGTGRLHLRATSILVMEGGTIDATGVGKQGKDGADGEAILNGGGKISMMPSEPGGGGAFHGAGSPGTDSACAPLGGVGGEPYDDGSAQLGSAGGDSTATTTTFGGGDGGGIIILEANTVRIEGTVTAAGGPGPMGVAAGGGAGGTIAILAYDFTVGPAAVISVAGGDGGKGPGMTNGGGGGGGIIILEAPEPLWSPILDGGVSGLCTAVTGGAGEIKHGTVPVTCFDLDNDKVTAPGDGDGCSPVPDCDDVDNRLFPGNPDTCDGLDNDCQGGVDDPPNPEAICDDGQTCGPEVDGGTNHCYGVDAGADGGLAEAQPDRTEFVGGCSTGGAGAASLAGVIVAWALALAARRRRT